MGDVVMLTTLIRLVAARYGGPVDVVGSGAWTLPLLAEHPAVAELRLVGSRKPPYLLRPAQWALVRWLRMRGRGPVYMADKDIGMRALLRRAGVDDADMVERSQDDAIVDGQPLLWPDRWLRMGARSPLAWPAPAIDPAPFRWPLLHVTAADRDELARWRAARGLEGRVVLFQPGNKRTHKRGTVATRDHPKHWPAARWAQVAAAVIRDRPGTQVLLCGSAPEHAVLDEIRDAADTGAVHNLAGDLPIPRLLALLEVADGMLSVDTGPAHAAAALGCPLVVLFGAASPALWRPIGPGQVVTLGGERGEASRVADLDVADVVAAWSALRLRGEQTAAADAMPPAQRAPSPQ